MNILKKPGLDTLILVALAVILVAISATGCSTTKIYYISQHSNDNQVETSDDTDPNDCSRGIDESNQSSCDSE